MARIAIFTERYTISRSPELTSLSNFRLAAFQMGHQLDFVFRNDIQLLENYDAVFIRALTDPMNVTYVVSRMAEMKGKRVLDDSESIRICCDKVYMYKRLMRDNVSLPDTVFLDSDEVIEENAHELFETLGVPLVLKAPESSFSAKVEKVSDPQEFVRIGKRFLRRTDRIIAQQFIPSDFDWRVVTLAGKALAVVKYVMPKNGWRIYDRREDGKTSVCTVQCPPMSEVSKGLIDVALSASRAVGNGLYGVDIKEVNGEFFVIEVNDNPNIDAGFEDEANPEIYSSIVKYLVGEDFEGI
ncbi:MAG: RimK family alpha-L-glutamate ligase [Methanomassiliicoccales archaeon]|nr:RimK family alpha-L-glutamate ligase [Methanomassiliicoccales archaeon]NYT14443.1 RimK family alpha-L-glutamate ligase [Methanomassiliicoccales archaeon]